MRIFGFLDQKRSKTIQILSQNFDCYGVIKVLPHHHDVEADAQGPEVHSCVIMVATAVSPCCRQRGRCAFDSGFALRQLPLLFLS